MKATILAGISALVWLVTGCSQQAPVSSYLIEDAPATANTKSKIGVDIWAMRGSNSGVEVKGQSVMGKVMHELKITLNTDFSCNAVKSYRDAGGNIVASVQLKVDKNGKTLSRTSTGNPGDAALCPECMGNDLKATDPSVIPGAALSAQATRPPGSIRTPCERAQRRLTRALAELERLCDPLLGSNEACMEAGVVVQMALQDINEDCPVIVPVSVGTPLKKVGVGQRIRAG